MSDLFNIIPLMSIFTFIAIYTVILLILHLNRNKIGFGPLFAFVGVTVGFFNYISVINILVIAIPGAQISLLSTTLVAGVIATVLFIYLTEGREKTRELIIAVITAEILTIIFPLVVSIYLRLDTVNITIPQPYQMEFFDQTIIYSFASLISIVCDSFFAVIFFQYFINRMPQKPSSVPIIGTISLIGASIVDAFLFPIITGFLGINYIEMIINRLPRFIVVSLIYAVVFTIYAQYIEKGSIFRHIGGRPSLGLLMRRRFVTVESFLAEKRRAEILLNLMSHDVNNILQVSVSALELMKSDNPGLSDSFPVMKLENSNKRLMKISHAISVIGGLQFVNEDLILTEKIELVSLCRELIEKLKKSTNAEIEFQEDPNSRIYIKFNPLLKDAISEILDNSLVHNDVKPDGEKRVSLTLKPSMSSGKKNVTINVQDNGPGVNSDLRNILLDPLDNITKRTGIGYIMLKLATDLSSGEYKIYSDDNGSRIEIKIPL